MSVLPLCVDLDGTLIRTDVTYETTRLFLKKHPLKGFLLLKWLLKGRACLKDHLARVIDLDISSLPYHWAFLEFLKNENARGRPLILATAADQKIAHQIADYLKIFQEVVASDGRTNQRAHQKARTLVEKFGEKGFAYAGNSKDDLAVWAHAAEALAVSTPPRVLKKLQVMLPPLHIFE